MLRIFFSRENLILHFLIYNLYFLFKKGNAQIDYYREKRFLFIRINKRNTLFR